MRCLLLRFCRTMFPGSYCVDTTTLARLRYARRRWGSENCAKEEGLAGQEPAQSGEGSGWKCSRLDPGIALCSRIGATSKQ